MSTTYHVAVDGTDTAAGTRRDPLGSIDAAAQQAMAGDRVLVHEGEYREWVRPARGGRSEQRRITYEAAPGEHVVIKGSERVSDWTNLESTVWKATVPAAVFGAFNPFARQIEGDWIVYADQDAPRKHLGDVYLGGSSLVEATNKEEVFDPPSTTTTVDDWTGVDVPATPSAREGLLWFAEVSEESTTIWANFQGGDPNTELCEINVRPACFFPIHAHCDYITVRGFEMAHAATDWAPPTADQPGMIGPAWAKGWIIEDNDLHDAKCSAISLGKNRVGGHNYATLRGDKPGYQYQLESVFAARREGWSQELIGSHVVRRNTIYDCGQTGIVGHLGAIFSTIEENHIHQVGIKREVYGYEIAGIKLHAAIDVTIRANRIHDCSLGTWLDWQTQGTRICRNAYYRNNRDLFIEVSHGPYVVDHNLFASPAAIENFSQGGAYVNNLIAGTVVLQPVVERPTPYHLPHSTEIAGYAAIYGGDDRWVGNVFAGSGEDQAYGRAPIGTARRSLGTAGYAGHPSTLGQYLAMVGDPSEGDHERFEEVPQPVYIARNAYAPDAQGHELEDGAVRLKHLAARVVSEEEAGYLHLELSEEFDTAALSTVTGDELAPVRFVDADFEDRAGGPVVCDVDLLGEVKTAGRLYPLGPVAGLSAGSHKIRLW